MAIKNQIFSNLSNKLFLLLFVSFSVLVACSPFSEEEKELANRIKSNEDLSLVQEKAKDLIAKGFTAGDGYGEVWIRDFNTFMDLAIDVHSKEVIRKKLITFFNFQGDDGFVIDGYKPKKERVEGSYRYILSDLEPQLVAHKNTVETDQETSLVQAVYKYVLKSEDKDFLNIEIDGLKISERLELALDFLMKNRYNEEYGLIWGGTTADWGDVQPEHDWGVFITDDTHYSIDIYDNAMLVIAMKNLIELVPNAESKWLPILESLELNIRKHLWDADKMKYHPHIYLDGSPFPDEFDEDVIFYQGGTALAIEAGLLSRDEIKISLDKMIENIDQIGAGSIGLSLYPAYPSGYFKNFILTVPYTYQNGGDWTWFGGRMIQQLVINGFIEEAYDQLLPFTDRVIANNGFYEWYTIANEPKGSSSYKGSAGVLYTAIQLLESWAAEVK